LELWPDSLALPSSDGADPEMLASPGEPIWLAQGSKGNLAGAEIEAVKAQDPNS